MCTCLSEKVEQSFNDVETSHILDYRSACQEDGMQNGKGDHASPDGLQCPGYSCLFGLVHLPGATQGPTQK